MDSSSTWSQGLHFLNAGSEHLVDVQRGWKSGVRPPFSQYGGPGTCGQFPGGNGLHVCRGDELAL